LTARVLIVEDDVLICRLLQTVLGREGLDVEATGDGSEALEWIRSGRFGVVVLDLMLPGLSGYEVLASCVSLPPPRPMFLVTTAFDTAFLRRLDPAIVEAVVTKPFDVPVLATIVREAARGWPHLPAVIPRARGIVPASAFVDVADAEPSY
jgi:two-component system, OmpR family, response regulator